MHISNSILPDPSECQRLFRLCHTPPDVIAHGEAVAQCALELTQQLNTPINTELLSAACLLHDLARGVSDHAAAGAQILAQEGYPFLADVVAVHHDLPEDACPEACLLYLADKLVKGNRRISLKQRFLSSREKCHTPEAFAAWQKRYDRTLQVIQQFRLILDE